MEGSVKSLSITANAGLDQWLVWVQILDTVFKEPTRVTSNPLLTVAWGTLAVRISCVLMLSKCEPTMSPTQLYTGAAKF